MSAASEPSRAAFASALAPCSCSSARLDSPVSVSCVAWWRRRREARATMRNRPAHRSSRPPMSAMSRERVSDAMARAVGS